MHAVWTMVAVALVSAVVVCAVVVWIAVVVQRRRLSGPELDAWRRARRALSRADRRRVIWATARQRLVDRADLAQAQVACTRLRQLAAERAPYTGGSWLRVVFPLFYGVGAVSYIFMAVTGHGAQHVLFGALAAMFATCGILWAFVVPRSVRRQADQMARLRRRVEDRYAG